MLINLYHIALGRWNISWAKKEKHLKTLYCETIRQNETRLAKKIKEGVVIYLRGDSGNISWRVDLVTDSKISLES
jgi:hypothetical protein